MRGVATVSGLLAFFAFTTALAASGLGTCIIESLQEQASIGNPKTKPIYPSLRMNRALEGEDKGEAFGHEDWQVRYLSPEQREKYRVVFTKNKTMNGIGQTIELDGQYIYVMDTAGNFYLSKEYVKGVFHHTSFLAGEPVAAAGVMLFEEGKLVEIDRMSGHYLPDERHLHSALSELKKSGFDIGQLKVFHFK
jgi:hypothetical protein